MKTTKKIIIGLFILTASLIIVACENANVEPDITPIGGEYILPDPTILTPEQTEHIRLIVAEYNEAISADNL